MVRIAGRQADFRTQAARGEQIEMHFRVDRAPTGRVQVGVRCIEAYTSHPAEAPAAGGSPPDAALCAQPGGAMVDLTRAFHDAPAGQWTTLSYSLSCFSAHDADLSNVAAPFAIETDGRFELTITDIRLIPRRGPPRCGGA
jgi:hypothetical protein